MLRFLILGYHQQKDVSAISIVDPFIRYFIKFKVIYDTFNMLEYKCITKDLITINRIIN
jgi:hypothetical protein